MHRESFIQGYCDAMALALHQRLHLPLGLIQGEFDDPEEPDERFYVPAHAVVIVDLDQGLFMDVDGLGTLAEAADRCVFTDEKPLCIVLTPVSDEEVRYAFSMAGVGDEEIALAHAYLDAHPEIVAGASAALKRHARRLGVAPGPGC